MWALRILNGPQAGQFYILKQGKNKIGRAATCDFVVTAAGVSKEHAEVTIYPDKVIFMDLGSSNGTFLNGVRVKTGMLRMGDKLSLHQVLLDLIVVQDTRVGIQPMTNPEMPPQQQPMPTNFAQQPPPMAAPLSQAPIENQAPYQGAPPMQALPGPQQAYPPVGYPPQAYPQAGFPPGYPPPGYPQAQATMPAVRGPSLIKKINDFVESVALPGVYRMSEVMDFKTIVFGFGAVFVLAVTLLSVIPMKQITAESVQVESRRRALTVARALAQANERVFRAGDLSSFSTDLVLREEGIDDVYIISKQGTILAPPERVGMTPREAAYLRRVIVQDKNQADEVGGRIVAAIPILGYDANLQQNVAKAYTVVVYNPGSLTFDDGRALGLFVQMLAIAFLVGGLLFFLLYKLIEYPFIQLNVSLDQAMREGKDNAQSNIRLPALQNLLTNVNSLLARALTGPTGDAANIGQGARNQEYLNVLELVGYPGMLLTPERKIFKVNASFEALTGIQPQNIEGRDLTYLPDQALQKNISELTDVAMQSTHVIAKDQLDFGGLIYQLNCQVFTTSKGEVDCFLVTISQAEGQAAGGAA